MYKDLKGKGLEILAFPCNQFGAQEPEDATWILDFVKQYPVEFHMMEKVDVQTKGRFQHGLDGPERIEDAHETHPTYQWLRDESELQGGELQWNFEKFLLNGEGKVVKHYRKDWEPSALLPDIEALLQ